MLDVHAEQDCRAYVGLQSSKLMHRESCLTARTRGDICEVALLPTVGLRKDAEPHQQRTANCMWLEGPLGFDRRLSWQRGPI